MNAEFVLLHPIGLRRGMAAADRRGMVPGLFHLRPHRSLIAAGVPAPGHSDFAVCRVNPFTTLGAWAQREEHDKGSLEVGKLADLAVLDTDILQGDPAAIRQTRVIATAVGGAVRHAA